MNRLAGADVDPLKGHGLLAGSNAKAVFETERDRFDADLRGRGAEIESDDEAR